MPGRYPNISIDLHVYMIGSGVRPISRYPGLSSRRLLGQILELTSGSTSLFNKNELMSDIELSSISDLRFHRELGAWPDISRFTSDEIRCPTLAIILLRVN